MSLMGIRTYLEPDLAREVGRLARFQGRSESSVIAEAVRSRFAAEAAGAQAASAETKKRQLNRIEARIDKLMRDEALIKECLFVFMRIWLEHNPPLEDDLADSLAASAAARFDRLLDLVAVGLQRGGSIANGAFPDYWPSDRAPDEAEAHNIDQEPAP